MIRVAIDSGPLMSGHSVRGIGVHTRELIAVLQKISKEAGIELVPFEFSAQNSKLKTQKFDIIHYPYFHPFFITLPFQKMAKKVVVTIHDLIPLIYPNHYPPGIKGSIRFLIQKFLLKNVDAIITISETSKKDICRFLGVHPDKVHVVYLAPREIFKPLNHDTVICNTVSKRYSLPRRFALYVGDINYNKNIPNLIKACNIAKIPLVICGKQATDVEEGGMALDNLTGPRDYLRYLFGIPHPELAHYQKISKLFKSSNKVIRLGYIPDEDLVAIYNLAAVYIQPSIYEGFGLPVLEAIACGTHVVAAKTQALVEIAEGGAFFVHPSHAKDMAKGFKNLIKNPKLPREYSWEKTARETLRVYELL